RVRRLLVRRELASRPAGSRFERVVPAAAAQDALRSLVRTARVDGVAGIRRVPVRAPFADVPGHVEEAPRVRTELRHRLRFLRAATQPGEVAGAVREVAPWEVPRDAGVGGVLPFRLGGEGRLELSRLAAEAPREVLDLVPAHRVGGEVGALAREG